jgi:hypothetical protein
MKPRSMGAPLSTRGGACWLDEDKDKRFLELIKKEGAERKVLVEDKWAPHLQRLRSCPYLDRVRELFR